MDTPFIYGIHPVTEALNAGSNIDRVYIDKFIRGQALQDIQALCAQLDIPVFPVPQEKLDRFTRKNHQGVVALISSIEYGNLEEIITGVFEKGETPFILVLDGITDVRNFGAIARTAECAGVHAIVVGAKNSAPVSEDAVKTSSGALMRIPVCREKSLKRACEKLFMNGLRMVACTEKGDHSIYESDMKGPLAVIMGAEDTGISSDVIRKADILAKIPMAGTIESLNVSVATGIILFEALRQRG